MICLTFDDRIEYFGVSHLFIYDVLNLFLMLDKPFTFDRVIRIAIAVAIGWGIISLVAYLSDVLIPFSIALLLAYLINPLVSWIQRNIRIRHRILAVLISLGLITGCVGLLGAIVIPLIFAEMSHMKTLLTNVVNASTLREQAFSYIPQEVWQYIKDIAASEEIMGLLNFRDIKEVVQQILPGVWGVFSGTLSFLLGLFGMVIILLYLIFILMDFEEVSEGWKNLVPLQYRDLVLGVLGDFANAMSNYFRAQALIAFLVGILFAFGFWLIDLPLGILLGLFIGMLNMVPYLQVIGFIPATLFALMSSLETGESAWIMLGLVILVFVLVQLLQDAILVPRIMGEVTGFNPAIILLSLSIWGKVLGMLGLIIALPVTFLIYSYYKRFLAFSIQRSTTQE